MTKETTLKEKNSKLIWTFFTFNALVFYILSFSPIINLNNIDWEVFESIKGVWLLFLPLILFILNGLISSDQKATLCFWRLKHPLPGCRAFSKYLYKDDRIDKSYFLSHYAPLPDHPKEQNAVWFKIYKIQQEEPPIKQSHKDFLLGRDICSISFLFLIIGGITGFFLIEGKAKWAYIGFAFIQYLILVIVTQNHGKRFVCNVLAIESSKI